MKTYGIVLLAVVAVAAVTMVFRTMNTGSRDQKVSVYLEELAGKVAEMENKMNEMVATQIKSSENNRQVYGAVARLCTIFEGILQINQKNEAAPVSAEESKPQ